MWRQPPPPELRAQPSRAHTKKIEKNLNVHVAIFRLKQNVLQNNRNPYMYLVWIRTAPVIFINFLQKKKIRFEADLGRGAWRELRRGGWVLNYLRKREGVGALCGEKEIWIHNWTLHYRNVVTILTLFIQNIHTMKLNKFKKKFL